MIANYDSRVVSDLKIPYIMTLELSFMIVRAFIRLDTDQTFSYISMNLAKKCG